MEEANVIAQLVSNQGDSVGPQLELPVAITPAKLEQVLHGLLRQKANQDDEDNDDRPFAFYLNDLELVGDLGTHLTQHNVSMEGVLKLVFRPQAVFRVRAVTRCSASLPGHSEAVLAVKFSPDGQSSADSHESTAFIFLTWMRVVHK